MTVDKWFAKYKPIQNMFTTGGSWDNCLFETYGAEVKVVERMDREAPSNVWTLIEADGDLFICSGFVFVNRLGHFITKAPYTGKKPLDIHVD